MERRPPVNRRRLALGALYVVAVLNALLTLLIFGYILLRGSERDAENARMKQQIDSNNCALMDRLPAGGPLDPLRTYYHCGPGLPTTQETP
jgi:hypothetical protein